MSGRPIPASESVLLDYTSPSFSKALSKAIRLRHYSVAGSILVFVLLKAVIFISTSLFFVGPALHRDSVSIQYTNTFSTSDLVPLADYGTEYHSNVWYDPPFVASDPSLWSYLARLNNNATNFTNDATSRDHVYQGYSLSEPPQKLKTVVGPVDVFLPRVSCEAARLLHNESSSDYSFETPDYSTGELIETETAWDTNGTTDTSRKAIYCLVSRLDYGMAEQQCG
ncbi:hypothetical protein PG996_012033 [Apiospora saccharicola]|uniref:Uncharacterized protein n=1 Tax=Apiospora saccharicola TaxID=335842 RepID=A0ABR1U201_9PEZI